MEELTKSTTPSSSWPVSINNTCSAPLRECNTKDLLISITNQYMNGRKKISAAKPLICKAPEFLRRDDKSARSSFDPEVVAIGPYHRGKAHLEPAEEHKRAAAVHFTSGSEHSIEEFYYEVKHVAAEARACYADKFFEITDEEFTQMLFFDGCFVLHFIDRYFQDKMKEFTMSTHLHGFIMRDMFLLENQLPFVVLQALTRLKRVELHKFVERIIEIKPKEESSSTPFHLLDLLRTKLLGPANCVQRPGAADQVGIKFMVRPEAADLHTFRSVKELREVGIKFRPSKANHLREVKFKPGIAWGTLSLPKIVIDDLTRSRFLNMIALEMCPGWEDDYGITSFAWFLDCLIDRPEDVRELREQGILLNALGSDEQVANLFNELTTNLSPDFKAYGQVLTDIRRHREDKFKVSIYTFLSTHFSSPWTAIAFGAAVFLLFLSVVQTIFAVFPHS